LLRAWRDNVPLQDGTTGELRLEPSTEI
jgi:hypothetical protein